MIDIRSLEQYFIKINEDVPIDKYTFHLVLSGKENNCFTINVIVKQKDSKEEHLIKFRLGLGKDAPQEKASHKTHEPHFEIDFYKREEKTFSATLYFTFFNITEEKLFNYAKGTIVIITKLLRSFFKSRKLPLEKLQELIAEKEILEELSSFEPMLIEALYNSYKNNELCVREKGMIYPIVIRTLHKLKQYLGSNQELQAIYLPLLEKINS